MSKNNTFVAKRPSYNVGIFNQTTNEKANVGIVWINDDGSIRVRLNSSIVLRDNEKLLITLFPIKKRTRSNIY